MDVLKKGTPVCWKAPVSEGVIESVRISEDGEKAQYLVAYTADDEAHHRWFDSSELQVKATPAEGEPS